MPPSPHLYQIQTEAVLLSRLPPNTRRAYAQTLATALHHGHMQTAEAKIPTEKPNYKTTGHSFPRPRIIEAFHPGHERARIQPARIYLGNDAYQEALCSMHESEWDAWWDWLKPLRDKYGDRLDPPLLFRSKGSRVVPSEYTSEPEQSAALWVLSFAWVDLLVEVDALSSGGSNQGSSVLVVATG